MALHMDDVYKKACSLGRWLVPDELVDMVNQQVLSVDPSNMQ